MSYNVDELFLIKKRDGRCGIAKYLKKDDPTITEIEIPAEYNGDPIQRIDAFCFEYAEHLKRVVIPPKVSNIDPAGFAGCKSLETVELPEGLSCVETCAFMETNLKSITLPKNLSFLGSSAFESCHNLESVTFNSAPTLDLFVFRDCPKLPPETVIMGLVRSTDITRPITSDYDLSQITAKSPDIPCLDCFRPDVFEFLAKNNSFRYCDLEHLFKRMAEENKAGLFPVAEQYGLLESKALVDALIGCSVELRNTELTAYLLELKSRKFGFGGGDDFEL